MTEQLLPFETDRQSQNAKVLAALKRGERLTPDDIYAVSGSRRSSGRIWDLRHGIHDGVNYNIKGPLVKVKTRDGGSARVAQYYLDANAG